MKTTELKPQIVEVKTSQSRVSSLLGGTATFILESVEAVIVALAICTFLYLFIITPHEVLGSSMHPSFEDGEYLIADKISYKLGEPERGDVIIFKHSPTQDYIKRVIGIPGETVALLNGKILIDGEPLDESIYLESSVYTNGGVAISEGESYKIPTGKYFVMGDNRLNSSDSRVFGAIDHADIKGKAWVVYFPFNQLRVVKHINYIDSDQ